VIGKKWPRLRDIPLKRKAVIFCFLIVFLPLTVIYFYFYEAVSGEMLEKISYSAKQGYNQSLSFIEYKLYWVIKISGLVETEESLNKILTKPRDKAVYTIHEQLGDMKILRTYLQAVEYQDEGIALKLFVEDDLVYAHDDIYINPISNADNSQWYQKKGKQNLYFSPGAYLEKSGVVSLVRDIVDNSNYSVRIAVLRIDMEEQKFTEILQNTAPTGNSLVYLMNAGGTAVAVSDDRLMKAYTGPFDGSGIGEESALGITGLNRTGVNGRVVYRLEQPVKYTDWKIVMLIPEEDIIRDIRYFRITSTIFLLSLGIVFYCFGFFFISSILNRLSNLAFRMRKFEGGNVDARMDNDRNDEIGVLYDTYNGMIGRILKLMDEKYAMGKELQNAEYMTLQSQINPHFLYNTLDMINWLNRNNQIEELHATVIALARYFKIALNRGSDVQTVAQELEHIRCYMDIQLLRYKDSLAYDVYVPPEMLGLKVPKITLQPLVENAIRHGILETDVRKGKVCIRGAIKNQVAYLSVIDNGVGMDQAALDSLLNRKATSLFGGENSGGYGIRNVNARLHLMFGEEYGLRYKSAPGFGVMVTVVFPVASRTFFEDAV
jgi:two-component system sensor histidine kinase YesM